MTIGGFMYACRFDLSPFSERLFVCLRSDRVGVLPPVFSDHTAAEMHAHVLRVSDPTLLLGLTGASPFYGTESNDPVLGLILIAERVAGLLGLDRSQIIYWGVSGAAMGAAMAAVKSGACGVLINPFLDGNGMSAHPFAPEVAAAFGAQSFDEITANYPLRCRVAQAFRTAVSLGLRPKLLLAQNEVDQTFYQRQYAPFCAAMGVPLHGGLDPTGSILSLIYKDPDGHVPEKTPIRVKILAELLPQLRREAASYAQGTQDLHLVHPGQHALKLNSDTSVVRLLSTPAHAPTDPRPLGACVTEIRLDGAVLPLSDVALTRGFHILESDGAQSRRWTDGEATIWMPPSGTERELQVEVSAVAAEFA